MGNETSSPTDLIIPKVESLDDFIPDETIIVKTEDQDFAHSLQGAMLENLLLLLIVPYL